MDSDAEDAPYLRVNPPSTTSARDDGKIGRPRRSRRAQWRKAPPLPGSRIWGRRAPVRVEFRPRISSEVWVEVEYSEGRFWIDHNASVWDLIVKLQEGGFMVAPRVGENRKPKRS